jgi:hypothetical protein
VSVEAFFADEIIVVDQEVRMAMVAYVRNLELKFLQ